MISTAEHRKLWRNYCWKNAVTLNQGRGMQSEESWEENPLRKLAERSLEKPGMYLIALRAHLNRGQDAIGQMIDTVADALPQPAKLRAPDES
jgi:hypothetical protein